MAYQRKPNTFSLFTNSYKEKETHPDRKGEIKINVKEFKDLIDGSGCLTLQISAWINEDKNGNKFLAGQASKPFVKEEKSDPVFSGDDIPFDL